MKVIYGFGRARLKHSCIAIGIFDGLHRGHQLLLAAMVKEAKRLKAVPVVITFFPHPAHVLSSRTELGYLVSLHHRFELLKVMGVKLCFVIRFTPQFAAIEPEIFIHEDLVGRLGAKAVFIGADFRFGKDRRGDVALFKKMGEACGFTTHGIAPLKSGSAPISSTRLRALVASGKLNDTKRLLGRPFSIIGEVVKGHGRGRKLGYPTANLKTESDILPPNGIYAVRVIIKGKQFNGAASLGLRPTFKEKSPKVLLEVYILDFNKNIYGQTLEVFFIHKIRNERAFATPDDLIRAMQDDVVKARKILK